ncbi:MAG: hypothetical protein ACYC3W_09790 [Candidatus Nanopelagicales bacterium]
MKEQETNTGNAPVTLQEAGTVNSEQAFSFKTEVKRWIIEDAPQFISIVLLAATVVILSMWGILHTNKTSLGSANIVSFDVIKLGNAERAIASGLIGPQTADTSDNGVLLMQVSKRVTAAIQQEAHGAVVIVKQAVVSGDIPDITDAVLKNLGLPVKVPEVNPMRYLTKEIPTDLGFSVQAISQDTHLSIQRNIQQARAVAEQAQGTAKLVP